MDVKESETVKAARDRMDANKDGKINMADLEATGIRTKIIDLFEIILWVTLALGVLSAILQIFTPIEAIKSLVQTVAIVGVGFVVLDIRERLIARG